MATTDVIQFPLKHGPLTERESATQAVQQAAENVFGRRMDAERANRMAELLMQLKRRLEQREQDA
ncbi:MAG: hypothetical protein JSR63_07580 [Proteobacteria bacterium]|nr:hypothetical protein [Pseudomonadota bacterium]